MDIGSIWNSFYMDQLAGAQSNVPGVNPFQTSAWPSTGFADTLGSALSRYAKSGQDKELQGISGNMDVSSHEGSVVQLGYGKALVYLPEEQKLMIVKSAEAGRAAEQSGSSRTGRTSSDVRAAKAGETDWKGVPVNRSSLNRRYKREV